MTIEIDQSGKIEETAQHTFLAFSNGKSGVVVIESRVKQKLQERFRRIGKPKLFVYRTFVAGVFLLVNPHIASFTAITIDIEWQGKERLIADIFFELLHRSGLSYRPDFDFALVGKRSRSHVLAWSANRAYDKNKEVARPLSFGEIVSLALPTKKKDRGR